MIRREVKLRLTAAQAAELDRWLLHLTAIYNWSLRRIEQDAANRIYHTQVDFLNLLAGTAPKIGVPSQVIQGTMLQAYTAWQRCFQKLAKKPKLRGRRKPLVSIHFPDRTQIPAPGVLKLRGFTDAEPESPRALLRYQRQRAQAKHDPARGDMIDALPKDKLRGCRLVMRASGWYASLVVEMAPAAIPRTGEGAVGIDPGFATLLTLSTGEKIAHPREVQRTQHRIAQAQRGKNRQLLGRLQERLARQVRDRNHKLSRRLVAEHRLIVYSKDRLLGLARLGFGGSVRAAHGQLRTMLLTKSLPGGSEFREVAPQKSTMTCSACGALAGPRGRAGLRVRAWTCSGCGTHHDRDVNAAMNTLRAGGGQPLESCVPAGQPGAPPQRRAA